VLDRKSNPIYFQDTSVVRSGFDGILTEREEQTMKHEDKSQYAKTLGRPGLVDCLITRP